MNIYIHMQYIFIHIYVYIYISSFIHIQKKILCRCKIEVKGFHSAFSPNGVYFFSLFLPRERENGFSAKEREMGEK